MNLPLNPAEVARAAIASGLLTPAPTAQRQASTILRKLPPKKGDKVSRKAQAEAMASAGWSHERIAKNLQVTTRSVENYLMP